MPTLISGVQLSDLQLFVFNLVKNYKLISPEEMCSRNRSLNYNDVVKELLYLHNRNIIRKVCSYPNRYCSNAYNNTQGNTQGNTQTQDNFQDKTSNL